MIQVQFDMCIKNNESYALSVSCSLLISQQAHVMLSLYARTFVHLNSRKILHLHPISLLAGIDFILLNTYACNIK